MDLFSTDTLLGMYGVIDRPRPFLFDTFFGTAYQSDDEEIHIDRIERARRLAPFVAPTIAGKVQRDKGFKTLTLKPAYVKPKHAVTPDKMQKRIAGERLTGDLDPQSRYVRKVMELLSRQDDDITRREEWMASTMLRTGKVICVSDDFPTLEIDVERNAAHTVALLTTARWGESGVDPYDDLKAWAETVQTNSGYHPGTVIVDPKAGGLLAVSAKLQAERQAYNFAARATIDGLGRTAGGIGEEVKFLGETPEFKIWQYQQLYADDAGNVQKYMPDYTVIMGSPSGAGGLRLYGAIQDNHALRAMERFPKMWEEQDPSVTNLMTQSAPLAALGWADATFCATVR